MMIETNDSPLLHLLTIVTTDSHEVLFLSPILDSSDEEVTCLVRWPRSSFWVILTLYTRLIWVPMSVLVNLPSELEWELKTRQVISWVLSYSLITITAQKVHLIPMIRINSPWMVNGFSPDNCCLGTGKLKYMDREQSSFEDELLL